MRLTTSDGLFGFVIEPTTTAKFMVFQIVIEGQLIGDRAPCILGTAMQQLRNLAVINVGLPHSQKASPSVIFSALQTNDDWNDATLLPLAESLDSWQVRGFADHSEIVFLARQNGGPKESHSFRMATLPVQEYDFIVKALIDFWAAFHA